MLPNAVLSVLISGVFDLTLRKAMCIIASVEFTKSKNAAARVVSLHLCPAPTCIREREMSDLLETAAKTLGSSCSPRGRRRSHVDRLKWKRLRSGAF
jgi:hypothetical protein